MKAKLAKGIGARRARGPAKARQVKRTTKRPLTARNREAIVAGRWVWHYRTLLALRDRLLQETRRKLRDVSEGIEPHSMHLADSATDEFDHDLALAMLAREGSALTEVNDAITRILEGRYGRCEETGDRIPAARLRAIPWCRFGRAVEERLEQAGTVMKFRLPAPASLSAGKPSLPGTGRVPPETLMEGETEEPAEDEATADVVAEVTAVDEEENVESPPPPR